MGFRPGWEWLLVLLVVVVLFGAKRLPDTARSLGRSMRILKSEVKGMKDDDEAAEASRAARASTTTTTAAVEGPVEPVPAPAPQAAPPAARQARQP